jgi:hypothetical protein
MSITDYNLYITAQLTRYGHLPNINIINNNTKSKDQFEVETVITPRNMCIYIKISKS